MAHMDEDRTAMVVAERVGVEPATPDRAADDFEAFFLREHAALFRALWLMTRSRHEAEEVMQDAFLRLWERWPRVRAVPDPTGYLYRTAMNVYRSRLRRAAVALRKGARWMPPDDGLEAVEARDVVVRAMASLSPRQRAAVVLIDVLGLSSEQAGSSLGVRAVTVRVQAARGREALRKAMGDRDAN
jgi:RNA polymerase sigma factor (sigma-70 family)